MCWIAEWSWALPKAPPKMPIYVWNWCFQNNLISQNLNFLSITYFPFRQIKKKTLHNHVDINVDINFILTRIILTSSTFKDFDIQRIGVPIVLTWEAGTTLWRLWLILGNGDLWSVQSSGDFIDRRRATLTSDECFRKCCTWFNACVKY